MDLREFAANLRDLIGDDSAQRPFVCDASPLECRAFIVGSNAATDVPFWPFWDDTRGFDKATWERAYLASRRERGKPGPSSTRRRIELIVANAAPARCLETNVYATPSKSIADLPAAARDRSVLAYLMRTIEPRVVVAHGLEAQREVAQLIPRMGVAPVVHNERHLSKVSYERARDVGRLIRSLVST